MMSSTRLAFALLLGASLAACGPGSQSNDGDDGSGDNGGGDNGGSNTPNRALDITGTYTVHSTFNIASSVPGTAGTVVNDIIDATDGPNDPTQWLLQQIANKVDGGSLVADAIVGLVSGPANSELKSLLPDFFTDLVQVGQDFGDATKNFGLIETLDIEGSAGAYTATHTVTGAHFKFGTFEADYLLANYNMPNIVVSNVGITADTTGAISIAQHDVPLAYGQVLRLGLDGAIIPLIDPTATNLNDLLADIVDCDTVGQFIGDNIDLEPILDSDTVAGFATEACTAGLNFAADKIYSEISSIDGNALDFQLTGTVKGNDTDGDGKVDTLVSGGWAGNLSYGSTTPSPLTPATFTGTRSN